MGTEEASGYGADRNGLGQISGLLGIVSLLAVVIPYGANLTFFLAPAAIITGLISRRRGPKKMANVGVVTGAIATLLMIALFVWYTQRMEARLERSFDELEAQQTEASN